ncbi:hypothetical protein FQA39_LY08019 [Lamprigera yunnana]|nr:hypothetical protein FQA39_LY08019 [Lamprigera yunnana]
MDKIIIVRVDSSKSESSDIEENDTPENILCKRNSTFKNSVKECKSSYIQESGKTLNYVDVYTDSEEETDSKNEGALVSPLRKEDVKDFETAVDYWKHLAKTTIEHCKTSSHMSQEDFDRLLKYGEYKYDTTKSYFKCAYLSLNVIDNKGTLNYDNLKRFSGLQDEAANKKLYDTCKDIEGEDLEEKMYYLDQCIYFIVNITTFVGTGSFYTVKVCNYEDSAYVIICHNSTDTTNEILKQFKAITDYWKDELVKTSAKCITSSGISTEAIERILKYGEFKYDDTTKSYLKCLYSTLNAIDSNGMLVYEVLKHISGFHDETFNKILYETCKDPEGATLEDKMYNMDQCIYFTIKYGIKNVQDK